MILTVLSRIALLNYADGEKRCILAPNGLKVGDVVFSGPESDIKPGNCLPLANIPDGTQIHNIGIENRERWPNRSFRWYICSIDG